MRTKEEVALVQALACEGLNHCQIARRTGIPRPTVRDWLTGKAPRRSYHRPDSCSVCGHERHDFAALPIPEYTYLLGIYLGDGCISTSAKGIHVLRLFQDMRYPDLIDAWAGSVQTVMPRNSVRVQWYVGGGNCASVISLSKSWPCLLRQQGPGRKHLRPIVLTSWQQELIDRDPRPLIAGRRIFCEACDQLGIPWRQPKEYVISIARREGVEALDSFIGPKS